MTMSPGSSSGSSCSITASTAAPALTISITLRGRARLATNSANVAAPNSRLPGCAETKASVTAALRLNTLTPKPRLSTLSTRFWPITARPMRPKGLVINDSPGWGRPALRATAAARHHREPQPPPLRGSTSLKAGTLFHAGTGVARPSHGT